MISPYGKNCLSHVYGYYLVPIPRVVNTKTHLIQRVNMYSQVVVVVVVVVEAGHAHCHAT